MDGASTAPASGKSYREGETVEVGKMQAQHRKLTPVPNRLKSHFRGGRISIGVIVLGRRSEHSSPSSIALIKIEALATITALQ